MQRLWHNVAHHRLADQAAQRNYMWAQLSVLRRQ
jgi:hypothetical protein